VLCAHECTLAASACFSLRYAVSALCETLYSVVGCGFVPELNIPSARALPTPGGGQGSLLRALVGAFSMTASPMWLAFTAIISPLPYR